MREKYQVRRCADNAIISRHNFIDSARNAAAILRRSGEAYIAEPTPEEYRRMTYDKNCPLCGYRVPR
jgi:hypothetical protein